MITDAYGNSWSTFQPVQPNPRFTELQDALAAATARADRAEADRNHWRDEYRMIADQLSAVMREQERAEAATQRVRELHSPVPGWEREWKDPAEALARGWVECAGCEIQPAGAGRYLKDCPTIAALDSSDRESAE